jgi:HAMP domain-containing protein
VFLVSIPFLLSGFCYGWFWEVRIEEGRLREERNLRGVLKAWAAESEPESAWHRLLQATEKHLRHPGMTLARQKATLQRLHQRFPGMFSFTVLDGQGCPIEALCDRRQPRVVWQKLYRAYRQLLQGEPAPWVSLQRTVHSLLGSYVPVGRTLSGVLLRADDSLSRRWLFSGVPHPEGWFLTHVAAMEGWSTFLIEDRIRRQHSRPAATRFYLVPGIRPVSSAAELASAPLPDLWEKLEPFVWQGERLWGLHRLESRLSLVAVTQVFWIPRLREERKMVAISFCLVWLFTLGLSCHDGFLRSAQTTSIRFRLIVAVGFAGLLPFSAIGLTTAAFVREHNSKLEGDLHFRVENALHDLDNLGPVLVDKRAKILFRHSSALSWPEAQPDVWQENILKLKPLAPWDSATIYGPGGKSLFTDKAACAILWNPEDFVSFDKVAGQVLQLIRSQNQSISSAARGSTESMDSLFGQVVMANYSENFDSMGAVSAGGEHFSIMLIPLMDEKRRIVSLLHLLWNRRRLERHFLEEHLLSFARDLPDSHLLVWHPNDPNRLFPERSRFWKPLSRLFPAIKHHAGCFGKRLRVKGDDFLVTAIRSEAFPGAFLVAITSNRFIRTEIREAISRVLGVGLLLIFGSLLVGWIFTQSFLRPLSLLGHGIRALRARDFTVRLPETGQDELGNLIGAFNQMAEGLLDIEGASRVRGILFPPGPLVRSPFSFCGRSPTNETLGRHIFDYGIRHDQKASFLIGSCHSSGITAGLTLALVKGILSHPNTSPDPVQAFQDLENTINPILGEGVALDMLFGYLDPQTGTIRLAGRNTLAPLLIEGGKAFPWVGARASQPLFDSGERTIPPGGNLLVLSGGDSCQTAWDHLHNESNRNLLAQLHRDLAGQTIEQRTEAVQAKLIELAPEVAWTLLLIERSNAISGGGSF